eukprot:3467320-Pyramimonas_sp.AAC.2
MNCPFGFQTQECLNPIGGLFAAVCPQREVAFAGNSIPLSGDFPAGKMIENIRNPFTMTADMQSRRRTMDTGACVVATLARRMHDDAVVATPYAYIHTHTHSHPHPDGIRFRPLDFRGVASVSNKLDTGGTPWGSEAVRTTKERPSSSC